MRELIFLLVIAALIPARLPAQASTPTDILTGRITDFAGRPVADAQVAVTSLTTGLTRSNTTNTDGQYRVVFPENATQYLVSVKRMGLLPVQRTITRRTQLDELITADIQFGGAPLALSMVEITGGSNAFSHSDRERSLRTDNTVPNPVAEILAFKDTLHLSAVQIFGLTDIADTLQTRNGTLYQKIRTLIAKSEEAGDITQMAGSVAIMLEEAASNTAQALAAAEKLLRPEQWGLLPPAIRERPAG